jgi:four helix bundle protein
MKSDLPERTFLFAKSIILFCKDVEKKSITVQVIIKQLIRSGTSVGANVEEAQSSQSSADFVHKYSIACKEAREF